MKVAVVVRADIDSEIGREHFRQYVEAAVRSWCGSLEPPNEDNNFTGDPLWEIDKKITEVK